MTPEEIWKHQRREQEFQKTPIGAALLKYERALERAAVKDASPYPNYNTLDALWAKSNEARQALVALLHPAAGLDP